MLDTNKKAELKAQLALAERIGKAIDHAPDVMQKDIAVACHRTVQAVSGWVKTGKVRKEHLPIIADVCGVSLAWLLTGQGPMKTGREHPVIQRLVALLDAGQLSEDNMSALEMIAKQLMGTKKEHSAPGNSSSMVEVLRNSIPLIAN